MSDARRQKRQRLNSLALDRFESLLSCLGSVVQNQRHPGAAGCMAIQWGRVEPQKSRARILDLKFVPHHPLPSAGIEAGYLVPVQLRKKLANRLALHVILQAKQSGDSLVQIQNSTAFVEYQDPVLDG